MKFKPALALMFMSLCFTASLSCAEEDNSVEASLARLDLDSAHWEFGIDGGKSFAVGNKTLQVSADNSVFLRSDPDDPGEDEFAENGLPSPDFTKKTLVSGKLNSSYLVAMHLYYKLIPAVALGVEASYAIQNKLDLTGGAPFQVPIYTTRYTAHGFQSAFTIRLGDWIGPVRPYVMAGAGPFILSQSVSIDLIDPDDPNHSPLDAYSSSQTYLSTLIGAGIDYRVSRGSVGISLQSQRVYKPGDDLGFLVPNARFAMYW